MNPKTLKILLSLFVAGILLTVFYVGNFAAFGEHIYICFYDYPNYMQYNTFERENTAIFYICTNNGFTNFIYNAINLFSYRGELGFCDIKTHKHCADLIISTY